MRTYKRCKKCGHKRSEVRRSSSNMSPVTKEYDMRVWYGNNVFRNDTTSPFYGSYLDMDRNNWRDKIQYILAVIENAHGKDVRARYCVLMLEYLFRPDVYVLFTKHVKYTDALRNKLREFALEPLLCDHIKLYYGWFYLSNTVPPYSDELRKLMYPFM